MAKSMIAERKMQATPCPTEAWPLPRKGECKLCHRSFQGTQNPITTGLQKESPFLLRKDSKASVCMPCCRTRFWAFQSRTLEELQKHISRGDNRILYMFVLFRWEQFRNISGTCVKRNAEEVLPRCNARFLNRKRAAENSALDLEVKLGQDALQEGQQCLLEFSSCSDLSSINTQEWRTTLSNLTKTSFSAKSSHL